MSFSLNPMRKRSKFAVQQFFFEGEDVAEDIRQKYGFDGDLLEYFAGNTGSAVHKWHHYIPIYDRYFAPYRGKPVRFLEIGVSKGGSLQMWRKYFGPEAVIFGIDINPDCAVHDGEFGAVRIGSQDDPAFLRDVVAEMGGVDVILDDGSHEMRHVQKSLDILFPMLATGGLYMVEDMHTAYWPNFGGGFGKRRNFMHSLAGIIDDMHRWYHGESAQRPAVGEAVSSVHVHDSIVVLEKAPVHRPVNSVVGAQ